MANKKTKEQRPDNSPYSFKAKENLKVDLQIRELPWTTKQQEIINLFLDKNTKLLILKGPAGTSKTIIAMYCGLQLLKMHKATDLVLVRSAVESADSKMGFLPGDLEEKYSVYLQPFNDKFQELLSKNDVKRLTTDNRITMCPINFARGLHFANRFVCSDESQNLTYNELKTLVTRLGPYSKTIICGDPEQSDLHNGRSGFNEVYNMFNNPESKEQGIFCYELTEEDIMRSELCKYIIQTFRKADKEKAHKAAMFKG